MPLEFDAFETSPAPMWVYDVATLRIVAANAAMAQAYGYPRAALLAMTILDLRPTSEHARVRELVSLLPERRLQNDVFTHLRSDGAQMHVSISSTAVTHLGQPARLVLARDITDQERAEERVHLIAGAMSDAAYDWNVISGDLWFSESFGLNFGFASANLPTQIGDWASLIHPADHSRVDASLTAAIEGEATSWVSEYCFQRGDGTYTEVLDRGYIQRDESGVALRMVGGMIDLRPQRLMSTRLRLLERAVESTGSGVLIADATDLSFPVVYANPAFVAITGFAFDDIEGRPFDFLQAADAEQPGAASVREALRALQDTQVALQGVRADGQPFWYDYQIRTMRDAHGRVTHLLGLVTDTSERRRHAQQLAWRSTHDVLTGLPNRHLMLDRVGQAVQRAKNDQGRIAVLIVDLDEFKLVNDELGHAAGDEVLCEVAARLRKLMSPRATLGRSVGDEFAILLDGCGDMQAELMASTVHAALIEPIKVGEGSCNLTVCVGYSHFPGDAGSSESLLMSAEMAMYQAKKQGRNCTVAYRAGRMPVTTGKLQLLQELREALERKEFRLLFQPVFSSSLRLVALEALVRWEHPRRGLLPPSEFISICEESGLIVELGRRVLHEAARHHAQLAEQGLGHVRISVNVSAMQFQHGLLDDVSRIIDEFELPRGALELELTESVILDDPDRAAQVMSSLADLGVTIAIDDFGVGYSSLSYLKRLPIHRLKIDRSFVNDLESDVSDRSICEAVIALARTLKLGVVAEGVESTFQRDWLCSSGAGELQGYLFARPLQFDDATQVAPSASRTAHG